MMHAQEQGRSNVMIRVGNRKSIGRLLFSDGAFSKQEIAHRLKLSLPTVNLLVQQLKDEELIIEQGSDVSTGGRKPRLLSYNYSARVAVGIEISQNLYRIMIINLGNQTLHAEESYIPFDKGIGYFEKLKDRVVRLLSELNIPDERVLGIGVAVPGIVMDSRRLIEFAPTLGLWNYVYQSIVELFAIPVVVANNANVAGFAEVWARKTIGCAAYLSVTKGVGGAIIINNRIFEGDSSRSGEFGHMTIVPGGAACSCGRQGCFEAYCSTQVLAKHADNKLDLFFKRLRMGDKALLDIWEVYLEYLAIGISNLRMVLDVEVILGGEISEYIGEDFLKLQNMVRSRAIYEEQDKKVTLSKISKLSAAQGAALTFVDRFISK